MASIDQSYKIYKAKEEEIYFKIFILYVDNRKVENPYCVLLDGDTIIKVGEPISVEEDGMFFKLGSDIAVGEYEYRIIGHIDGEKKSLLDGREVIVK